MRGLADDAGGWCARNDAQLRAAEDRLTELNADPASPLAEIAAEVRRVEALSQERDEVRRLIDGLEGEPASCAPRGSSTAQTRAHPSSRILVGDLTEIRLSRRRTLLAR